MLACLGHSSLKTAWILEIIFFSLFAFKVDPEFLVSFEYRCIVVAKVAFKTIQLFELVMEEGSFSYRFIESRSCNLKHLFL